MRGTNEYPVVWEHKIIAHLFARYSIQASKYERKVLGGWFCQHFCHENIGSQVYFFLFFSSSSCLASVLQLFISKQNFHALYK